MCTESMGLVSSEVKGTSGVICGRSAGTAGFYSWFLLSVSRSRAWST